MVLLNRDSQHPLKGLQPPVVHIPREVRRSEHVNEVYSQVLDEYGPVVIVPRHGRNEYVIDHRYAHQVLTDTQNFTFEKAAFEFLHLGFIALFDNGVFVRDVDNLIEHNVQPRMNAIIERILPVFEACFDRMASEVPSPVEDKSPVEFQDIFSRLQHAIAHAMVIMILGPAHSSPVTAGHFAAVAVAMAHMTGMHENTHEWAWFPSLWVLLNGLRAVLFTIVPQFFFAIVPTLWKTRHEHLSNGLSARHGEYIPLFDLLLVKNYHQRSGLCALAGFGWSVVLCVGMIFASIHQTVVAGTWILITLVQKQDGYLPAIREEWETVINANEPLSVKKLTQLTLLDSFMREVFRTKGDTWGPVRQTTRPVQVGPYTLPKDAVCMVLISRAHQHQDNYGSDGRIFDGFQWEKKAKPAVQSSPEFLAFGLGRWACPGRQLAVHEIKIMLYLFFSRFDVRVKEGSFRVVNWINTTSVPPEVTLLVRRRL
ncbi:cytochrome P450 [Aspergillus sclerotioniger CBS 115572]|uniref:Cytochrome P450 n=1 Tax=Aspergillus sclerotioniger CBS 115572 TaxID=1450535 RepID=A0A317X5P6_9EURO|nr:cytochrome P450 [Aspergillus sclerotioniger CBS 115572]PWY91870.1 cytochrome P450 [Aspergillus sclerotioniger CBS 115572]